MLFNILYSGGLEADKAYFLYKLCESPDTQIVHNHSPQLMQTLEQLSKIPTIILGTILGQQRTFSSE